jgi:hypothetical protein
MRDARLAVVSSSLLFVFATAAAAQPLVPPAPPPSADTTFVEPLTPDQDRELDDWLSAMEKWRRDDAKWQNRTRRNGWGRIVSRKLPPDAPSWLPAHCASTAAPDPTDLPERLAKACRLVADPSAHIGSIRPRATAARVAAEKPPKHSSFMTRLHLDGLWTTASAQERAYGLVGSHLSLVDVGRLQIFGPPGVILLSVPDGYGSRRMTLGYTWGISVRLSEVRLFGQRDMTLFLNVSKVWVNGNSSNRTNARGFDAMGFSLAPRKKPR